MILNVAPLFAYPLIITQLEENLDSYFKTLKNVEYDIATKNVLIKTAKWMMDETIRKKLEEQMVFDLSDLMNLTKKSIAESLNQTMDGRVKIKGTLKSLEISGWSLQQDALWVRAKTLGDIQVIME